MSQGSDNTIQGRTQTTQHSPDNEKFKVFHNKGRWQGLPLRVEDVALAICLARQPRLASL